MFSRVSVSERAEATREVREIMRIERMGALASRRAAVKLRRGAILALRQGRQFLPSGRMADKVEDELLDYLKRAMQATALLGWRQSIKQRRKQLKGNVRLLRLDMLGDTLDKLAYATEYWTDEEAFAFLDGVIASRMVASALELVRDAVHETQVAIRETVNEQIRSGATVRQGTQALQEAFVRTGLAGDKPYRLEQIFRTQTQLAHSAAAWKDSQRPDLQEILFGYKLITVGDDRVRPEHAAMDGTLLPKDDPFWLTNYPPNGYNCRCMAIPIYEEREIVRPLPMADGSEAIADPDFQYNPGLLAGAGLIVIPRVERLEPPVKPSPQRKPSKPPVKEPKKAAPPPSPPSPPPVNPQFALLDEKRIILDVKQARFDELRGKASLTPYEYAEFNKLRQELTDLGVEIKPLLRAKIADVTKNDVELEATRKKVIEAKRVGAGEYAKKEKELKAALNASAKETDKLEKEIRKNWNNPKVKAKLDKEYVEAAARHDKNRDAHIAHIRNKPGILEARQAVAYDGPTAKVVGEGKDKMPSFTKKRVEAGEEFINSLVPKDRLTNRDILYNTVPTGRAAYTNGNWSDSGKNEIKVDHSIDPQVVAHEIGHHLEYNATNVRKAAQVFLEKRLEEGGKANINFSQKYPGVGFRSNETGNEDKFGALWGEGSIKAEYAGKIVGSENSTEIISMGVEEMYLDAANFAEKDPEYFKFILGVLRGKI